MLNKIKTVDFQSKKAPEEFVNSLVKTGFAVVKNHSIDFNLINKVYDIWDDFFKSDDKFNYLFDLEKQDGYFPIKSENAKGCSLKDIKEFYHIYLPWGRIPPGLSKDTLLIRKELKKIATILLSWINDLTPQNIKNNFSIPLYDMIDKSDTNLLRIIHYPPIKDKDDKNALRAAAHEDINLITILLSGSEPGLQVQDSNSNWIDVESDYGSLIVNIGDMLQECSNGYYPSTSHRVVNPKGQDNNKSRYSMPFFLHPRDEVILSEKYTAKSYLDERLKELGLRK
ncbi:MAG: 2OG-Fe(II) oxygenase [Candidatus Marinimicrobia bacterium]|nr:2OG-Fe(II) oxygenase [Candidatus Neomarinimicrobiota bacterium]|tara:strand:- start:3103 stop:3951 length:849 start_codon:yes stop_codon:yes gene_type:complete